MAARDVGGTLFDLLVGREPRAALDLLVLLLDDAKQPGNLDNFVKQRKANCLQAVRVASRERANITINRAPVGTMTKVGYLSLV